MSPLFSGLSQAAGDGWSVNYFPTRPHSSVRMRATLCASEPTAGKRRERGKNRRGGAWKNSWRSPGLFLYGN